MAVECGGTRWYNNPGCRMKGAPRGGSRNLKVEGLGNILTIYHVNQPIFPFLKKFPQNFYKLADPVDSLDLPQVLLEGQFEQILCMCVCLCVCKRERNCACLVKSTPSKAILVTIPTLTYVHPLEFLQAPSKG